MKLKRLVFVFMAAVIVCTSLVAMAACNKKLDNESTRLVLSTAELDGVFNPFFSTSATDGNIVGMTQLGMINTDKNGNYTYGADEACVVEDYGYKIEGDTKNPTTDNATTTYTFVLKNNIKFSNGSPLTMKDVLFNLYVYLDPAYTGSATIYSTEIVGLNEYRTQTRNESEQDNFQEKYERYGADRVNNLAKVLEDFFKDFNRTHKDAVPTDKDVVDYLEKEVKRYEGLAKEDPDIYARWTHLADDYERTKKMFKEEIDTDWTNSVGTAQDINFEDGKYKLETDTQAFLFNEGFITWNKDEHKFEYAIGTEASVKAMSEQEAKEAVYNSLIPGTATKGIKNVITQSKTASNLISEFASEEMKNYFDNMEASDRIRNIEGIVFANKDKSVEVTNEKEETKTYAQPEYNQDGSVKSGNEVLQITIKGVDPKAIWNFAFSVAPMYYYSSEEEIEKFDYEEHFGVDFSNINFMNNYVKANDKIGLPMGAGPYKATTANGDSAHVDSSSFKSGNVVYFERNDYFMFPAQIKYVNYQVVSNKMMLTSLFNNEVHFVEPECKQDNINLVNNNARKGYAYKEVMTNGYGYIGINASKVPSHEVRQAIMYAIDTQRCLDYYYGHAHPITRPMTQAIEWAYPEKAEAVYKYDKSGETSKQLVEGAGYVKGSDGVYQNSRTGDRLEYTFTVAGDSTDHPAYSALLNAKTILEKIGFKITVQKDINALKKLNTGELTVWAAAWGSGVDPDMYQVYHIDSRATSTANWGYSAIRLNKDKYSYEYNLIVDLSDVIDQARQTLDQKTRATLYSQALDMVMQLAVELPTYQRNDMFAYNTKVIDVTTLTPDEELTPFNGPLARLWEVSFVGQESK